MVTNTEYKKECVLTLGLGVKWSTRGQDVKVLNNILQPSQNAHVKT
jgi:hypothetical protein